MRKKLKEMGADKRYEFVGTFRFGIKDGYKGPLKTVLLINVYHKGEFVMCFLVFLCGKIVFLT